MARILIIDDDPNLLQSLRRILETQGHTVSEAPDGKVALRRFAGDPADLVISDIYMPEMDGIEFLTHLPGAFPEAKIVTMSGGGPLSMEEVLEAASNLGAIGTLQKPFTVEDVLEVVNAALDSA